MEHHIGRLHASELQPLKRKHICNECDEKFAAESLLRVHKERPDAYSCDECDLKFTHEFFWRNHKGMPHVYPCDECDLKFVHRSNLRHHKGRSHASRLNPAVAKSVDNKFD